MTTVTAVERAFQLLRAVPASDGTLSDLARRTGLPLATVSRLMGTLEQAGAVLRTADTKSYRIGPTVVELAEAEPAAYDLLGLATTHLHELVAETDETAGVVAAVGDDCVHLGQVAAEHDVAVRDWTGSRVPLHHGAIGFVILANRRQDEIDRYLGGDLDQLAAATMTDPAAITARLGAIRQTGWLWTTDEYAEGVTTVAAAILDRAGHPVGSLHVHGPTFRFPPARQREPIGRAVADRAAVISAVLGWNRD